MHGTLIRIYNKKKQTYLTNFISTVEKIILKNVLNKCYRLEILYVQEVVTHFI